MKSKNQNFGAIKASNWLFIVVGLLMEMIILSILGEDENDKVKISFSKKIITFSWIIWTSRMNKEK